MATRKVRINDGSAKPLEIPEQAGKLHVKTSGGVLPLTELWAKDPKDSTAKLIWKPVPPVDVPTQISTQGTVDPGDPCVGAVCASGGLVEYPVIPGLGTRWDCSQWEKTGNCVRGSLVEPNGTFSWQWHSGHQAQEVAKIYEVGGAYSPPPPGHIILDYGTDDVSSRIAMFIKGHMIGIVNEEVIQRNFVLTTGSGINAECAISMPIFPGGSTPLTGGYTFSSSHGANSQMPYVYRCSGNIPTYCTSPLCVSTRFGQGGLINPAESVCECKTVPCIPNCCINDGNNQYPCGTEFIPNCLGTEVLNCPTGTTRIIDLINQQLVIPLIDTGCVRTNTGCSTVCYSVPEVQTPVLFGTNGTPPLLTCRSVCRVPNVVWTTEQIGGTSDCNFDNQMRPECMYDNGHKFSDFSMVMKGGCDCTECPEQASTCPTQGCASQFSMRIIMPFYFNFPDTLFSGNGVDLRGRIIDITFPGLFRAFPEMGDSAGNASYLPGDSIRKLPPILSGIRDLLVGRISSCCSVMAPSYGVLSSAVNNKFISLAGNPNICWCMNEFPRENIGPNGTTIPSHTHQLVIELNLGSGESCSQCFFSAPVGPDYKFNIDAFQFYPITDRAGKILEPFGSFLSKQLSGEENSGVSAIKSLRFMAHPDEVASGNENVGNVYSNRETTFTYNNRAEIDNAWEGVYIEVPTVGTTPNPLGTGVGSYIVTDYLATEFQRNAVGVNNSNNNILNKLLNVIQQPQYPTDTAIDCRCEAVP
jgi:hypothetical protein